MTQLLLDGTSSFIEVKKGRVKTGFAWDIEETHAMNKEHRKTSRGSEKKSMFTPLQNGQHGHLSIPHPLLLPECSLLMQKKKVNSISMQNTLKMNEEAELTFGTVSRFP